MIQKNFIACWTIIVYGLVRFKRSMLQNLLPPLVTNALYFTIFGNIIGHRIGTIDNHPYITFIAPGLIMMTIIMSSFNSTVGAIFFSKFTRQIEELLIAPIAPFVALIGLTLIGILRGLIAGLLVCGVAWLFVPLNFHHWVVALVSAILTAALFTQLAFINAIFARKWDDIAVAPTFIITPITYLGGIFFSVQNLPPFWQHVALYNPILYIINAFRYGMIGTSDIQISHAMIVMLLCVACLFTISCYLFTRGAGLRT